MKELLCTIVVTFDPYLLLYFVTLQEVKDQEFSG